MGTVKERLQCPNCMDSSEDNLIVYEDGGSYCFSCETGKSNEFKSDRVHKYKDISNRGISQKTCEKYNYAVADVNGKQSHVAPYYDEHNVLQGYKIRQAGKKFFSEGKITRDLLFGRQLFNPSIKRFIVITEGELDALSVYEVLGSKSSVVSLACGASSAKTAIAKHLEWLQSFNFVVLCFDNDEAGRKAVEEVTPLFTMGKVKVATLELKDANEMVIKGKSTELYKAIWDAKAVSLGDVKQLTDIELKRPKKGLSWKWNQLTKITHGLRTGELIVVAGGSGCGKTQFLMESVVDLCKTHQQKVGLVFLEQSAVTTKLQLAGTMLNKRLHIPNEDWDEEEIKGVLSEVQDKILVYDHTGGLNFQKLLCVLKYFQSQGCKYIVVDNLTSISAMTGQNERKELDKYIQELINFVIDSDVTVFLASHLAKASDGKSFEEGRRVTGSALRGSQSIQFGANLILGIERDKLAEDEEERNLTTIRIIKNRFSGEDGCSIKFKYDTVKGGLVEYDDHKVTEDMFKSIM